MLAEGFDLEIVAPRAPNATDATDASTGEPVGFAWISGDQSPLGKVVGFGAPP